MRIFHSLDEVTAAAGTDIGTSDWLTVEQDRIAAFADATDDHQWIHVDVEQAAAGPFGKTIAHGYLTLSLLPHFTQQVVEFRTPGPRLNYGLEKVRFPTPVPVGGRLRSHIAFGEITHQARGILLVVHHTVELEGADKPACVAAQLALLLE